MDVGICRYCGYDLINRKQTIIKTKTQYTQNSKKQQIKIRKKTNIELKKCPKCGVTLRKKVKNALDAIINLNSDIYGKILQILWKSF